MKKRITTILIIVLLISCDKDKSLINEFDSVCKYKTKINSPRDFEIKTISEIDFNGTVQSFKFVTDQIGYAILNNNVGRYVEVFKTTDGGITWKNQNIDINQYPRGIAFKNENIGIVTVHDVTGCPPPNCQNKCVILKTEDGGISWIEKEIENLKGILYHPQFDSDGNLYALLTLDNESALMKSTDDGETWQELFNSTQLGFNLVTFSYKLFENKLYISGKSGELFVVNYNGDLLKTIEIGGSIWDLEIIDDNNLIAVVSGKVVKSKNGGENWTTIYNESARMIGFDSPEKGLMFLQKSVCPTDAYQVNDLIGSTTDSGLNWIEADETTTNLRANFRNSQRRTNGNWYLMIENRLLEIAEK